MRHDRGEALPPSREIGALLLAALRSDAQSSLSALSSIPPVLAEAVSRAATRHQVLALVQHALAHAGGLGASDAVAAPPLSAAILATVAQHLRVRAELDQLNTVLNSTHTPWVVVKGPVLAELAYPDPALRPYSDLDVLVHPKAFGTVVTALESSGAVLLDQNWTLQSEMQRAQASFVLPYGTALDLHWHLINDATARETFDWPTEPSIEQRRFVAIGDLAAPTLDPIDTLLHVALHGALSGGHRLLWVKDIERLTRRADIEWEEFVRRARARRLTLPVGVMLRRSRRLLRADVPPSVVRELRLPRPSGFGIAMIERAATRAAIGSGFHTGRLVIANARTDAKSSGRALAVEVRKKFAPLRSSETGPFANPLQCPDRDPEARERYLQHLTTVS